jgi:hypothetical protein
MMELEAREILEDTKTLNEKQLKAYVEFIIKKRTAESKDLNEDNFIGYELPINLSYPGLDLTDPEGKMGVLYNTYFANFIHDKVKLYYGRLRENNNKMGSAGFYYYVNNHEFIYEFLNFIKDKSIENDIELISYAYYFTRNYFKVFGNITRYNISALVLDSHGRYIKPTKEHSLHDFKNKGCGMCSEYTAVMENILSFLGYKISYIMGTCDDEMHAYNIILLDNEYYLLDSSYCIPCYDINYNIINTIPYMVKLDNYDEEKLESFIMDGTQIAVDSIYALAIDKEYYEVHKESQRVYRTLTKNSDEI